VKTFHFHAATIQRGWQLIYLLKNSLEENAVGLSGVFGHFGVRIESVQRILWVRKMVIW